MSTRKVLLVATMVLTILPCISHAGSSHKSGEDQLRITAHKLKEVHAKLEHLRAADNARKSANGSLGNGQKVDSEKLKEMFTFDPQNLADLQKATVNLMKTSFKPALQSCNLKTIQAIVSQVHFGEDELDYSPESLLKEHCLESELQDALFLLKVYGTEPDESGNTPLHEAVESCRPAIVKIILESTYGLSGMIHRNNHGVVAEQLIVKCPDESAAKKMKLLFAHHSQRFKTGFKAGSKTEL